MAKEPSFFHAIQIDTDSCTGCTSCMSACPTEAIRIRNGKAVIYENRCVDCGECYNDCPVGAIKVAQDDFHLLDNYEYKVALVPAVFIGQFDDTYKTKEIYACLKMLGFTHIYEVEHSVEFIAGLYKKYMAEHPEIKTFISPYCPAVIRLIQVRFPSLVDNIIKLKSPLDAASQIIFKKLREIGAPENKIGIFYVTPCAAKIASAKSPVSMQNTHITGVINMDFLYNKVKLMLKQQKCKDAEPINHDLTDRSVLWPLTGGESANFNDSVYAIDGLYNALDFLENLEDEKIDAPGLIEMRLCDQSCVGGILTVQNRFVAKRRLENRSKLLARIRRGDDHAQQNFDTPEYQDLAELMRIPDIKPRSLFKLDDNLVTALEMAEKIKDTEAKLPSINCCACGAPSCSALAEDIIRGEACLGNCIFAHKDINELYDKMEDIWGKVVKL